MTSRFVLGVGCGLGLSFAILQATTERRIMSVLPLKDSSSGGSSICTVQALQRDVAEVTATSKDYLEKSSKHYWNTGVRGFADGLNSITSTISGMLAREEKKRENK